MFSYVQRITTVTYGKRLFIVSRIVAVMLRKCVVTLQYFACTGFNIMCKTTFMIFAFLCRRYRVVGHHGKKLRNSYLLQSLLMQCFWYYQTICGKQ